MTLESLVSASEFIPEENKEKALLILSVLRNMSLREAVNLLDQCADTLTTVKLIF